MDFIEYITFVCLSGATIGISFAVIAGVFSFIDWLLKGKLSNWMIKLFEE